MIFNMQVRAAKTPARSKQAQRLTTIIVRKTFTYRYHTPSKEIKYVNVEITIVSFDVFKLIKFHKCLSKSRCCRTLKSL